jgi:predicted membrane protein
MKTKQIPLFQYLIPVFLILGIIACTSGSGSSDWEEDDSKESKSSKNEEIIESNDQETIDGKVLQITSKTIKKAKADFVKANLKVRFGKFFINDGNNNFVDAEFIYDKYDLKPVMKYDSDNKRGDLLIKLTGDEDDNIDIDTDNDKTKCLVELSNDVPMDMHIELGAGMGKFNLNELQLEDLEIRLGAGKLEINLANSLVKNLDIEAGVGSVELDMSGERKSDLYAEILGGIGELDIKLPADVGVRAEVKGLLGDIDAYGFDKRDRVYTNDAYGKSEYTIELDIRAGLGDLNLILEE